MKVRRAAALAAVAGLVAGPLISVVGVGAGPVAVSTVAVITDPNLTDIEEEAPNVIQDLEAGGHTVIEVYLFQRRKIRFTSAHFHTHKGEVVSISPHYCRIGTTLTMFGDVVEGRGGSAAIG